MIRLGAIFWLVIVVAAGLATFKVKYAVQDVEDELNRVRKQTIAEQQEIRVLMADWTYLNQPERLAELNRRFLGLAPVAPKQLQHHLVDIPLRPPAAPDVVVASNAEPVPPALPVAPAAVPAISTAVPAPVRLAIAARSPTTASLDELIAQIAEAR